MEMFLPVAAFAIALLGTFRSLGWGVAAVVAVGYANGVIRANFLGVFSTFMFDAAVLGLYAGFAAFHSRLLPSIFRGRAGVFVLLLAAWPTAVATVPVNNYLVQLVALRGAAWLLPVTIIATRLSYRDMTVLARALSGLNLLALAVGGYEFHYGVEAVFPRNIVTELMYRSGDVAGGTSLRIPSTFINAHTYGCTIVSSLPFVLDRLFGRDARLLDRILAGVGGATAVTGLLLCAARYPIVILGVAVVVAWVLSRFSLWFGLAIAVVVVGTVFLASTSDRLQRGATLEDTEYVSQRVSGSVNESFLDVLVVYPAGAGMGSAFGTSIPYFLSDVAPEQVGLENEFSRITVDQGWVGLGLWLAFLGWLLVRPPPFNDTPWQLGRVLMYALVLSTWGTAFIGTGTLASIPGAVLLLTQMGVLARTRERPSPLSPAARPQ